MNRTLTTILLLLATASLTAQKSCGTVTDYDGNTYKTVQIGKQCWMAENLRTTHYANGTSIRLGGGKNSMSNTEAYRYYPDNNRDNVASDGYLYNWAAVMHGARSSNAVPSGVQGICPKGWHVPSNAEWFQLTKYVSSQSQFLCDNDKENIAKALAATTRWDLIQEYDNNQSCSVGVNVNENNATGFSALPAGDANHLYAVHGLAAYFWTSTSHPDNKKKTEDPYQFSYGHCLWYRDTTIRYFGLDVYAGFSVRCLRD